MPSSSSPVQEFVTEEGIINGEPSINQTPTSPSRFKGFYKILIFISLLSSALLFAFDQTVTSDSQQGIIASFKSGGEVQWISVPFMLGAVLSRSIWIKLYAGFNIKIVYLVAILTFCFGSIICGTASAMNFLTLGRTISGIGGSGMYVGALKIFASISTDDERSRFLGIPGLIWGLATILGPISGEGFSSSHVGWRFSFYIDLVVCAIFTPALVMLPSSAPTRPSRHGSVQISNWIRQNDPVGTFLLGGVYLTGLIAVSIGGIAYSWTDHRILLLLATCGCLAIIYCLQQALRLGKAPHNISVPDFTRLLKSNKLLFTCLIEACSTTSIFVPVYFIPLYLEFVYDKKVMLSVLHVLPLIATMIIMLVVSRAIISRFEHSYVAPWLYGIGGLLVTAGGTLLASLNDEENLQFLGHSQVSTSFRILAASILIGAGVGTYIQLPYTTLPAEVPQGLSLDLISYAQLAIPAVMLSFADTLYMDQSTNCIDNLVTNLTRTEIQELIAVPNLRNSNNSSSALGDIIRDCVGKSIGKVFVIVVVTGGLTVASTLLMYGGTILPISKRKATIQ